MSSFPKKVEGTIGRRLQKYKRVEWVFLLPTGQAQALANRKREKGWKSTTRRILRQAGATRCQRVLCTILEPTAAETVFRSFLQQRYISKSLFISTTGWKVTLVCVKSFLSRKKTTTDPKVENAVRSLSYHPALILIMALVKNTKRLSCVKI